MEKFQIAKYGMMQVTALAYGILACGTTVKLGKPLVESGYTMPPIYWSALFYRDHGILLLAVIIVWTIAAAYYSSPFPSRNIDERWLIGSGMLFFITLFLAGSILAFGDGVAATMPRTTI